MSPQMLLKSLNLTIILLKPVSLYLNITSFSLFYFYHISIVFSVPLKFRLTYFILPKLIWLLSIQFPGHVFFFVPNVDCLLFYSVEIGICVVLFLQNIVFIYCQNTGCFNRVITSFFPVNISSKNHIIELNRCCFSRSLAEMNNVQSN